MEASQELVAALTAHGETLAAELRALDDMPQVKLTPGSVFDCAKPLGSVAQLRGVICRLRCCGVQLGQKCNDMTGDAACPTHVEAARMLRAKVIMQHGTESCVARAQQKLAEEGSVSSGPMHRVLGDDGRADRAPARRLRAVAGGGRAGVAAVKGGSG